MLIVAQAGSRQGSSHKLNRGVWEERTSGPHLFFAARGGTALHPPRWPDGGQANFRLCDRRHAKAYGVKVVKEEPVWRTHL